MRGWFFLLFCTIVVIFSDAGHEVLLNISKDDEVIKNHEICIVQFESRYNTIIPSYFNTSITWNRLYAMKYGNKYSLWTIDESCRYEDQLLASSWCKVRAMIEADTQISAKAFLFLDSDAIITVNSSLAKVFSYIKNYHGWDWDSKPIAFNQDGPGWSCKATLKHGYQKCFNSGSLFWIKSEVSSTILKQWWHTSIAPFDSTGFPMNWRMKWPWEQAQQHEIYKRYEDRIMVLSFPHLSHLPWESSKNPKSQYPTDTIEPWCFSHWPGANCFITHFCASVKQKKRLMIEYSGKMRDLPRIAPPEWNFIRLDSHDSN